MNHFESLDPEDWNAMEELAHEMLRDSFHYLKNRRSDPVWRPMPEGLHSHFEEKLPIGPSDPREIYELFKRDILPYPMGNTHPRFWAWYMGSGTVMGALGDFLTSVISPNAGAGNHVGQPLEDQVISWMKEIMEYPEEAGGILVSGGSMANFVGLAVARNAIAGFDVRQRGLCKAGPMAVYGSTELHSCNQKAVELLGIGAQFLRRIPVNEDYTINLDLLMAAISKDRKEGITPICVIGSAGTVNTGAIDDLNALADLCQNEKIWFHVDGAIGALAMVSPLVRPLLKGLERSDSVAMDLHKWFHVPFEAACVLIRSKDLHRNTFSLIPEYLTQYDRGLASGSNWYSEYGLQLSRRLNALKIWMSLKEHGIARYGRMITRNIEQAKYLESLILANSKLEMIAPVGLDIVCFRYNPGGLDENSLAALNKAILVDLHESGIAVPSYSTLKGRYCLRVAIANHRSRQEDFDLFINRIIELGDKLIKIP